MSSKSGRGRTTRKSDKNKRQTNTAPRFKNKNKHRTITNAESDTEFSIVDVTGFDSDEEATVSLSTLRLSDNKGDPKTSLHEGGNKITEKKDSLESVDEVMDVILPTKPRSDDLELLEEEVGVSGKVLFGFNTPKKKNSMALAALSTPSAQYAPSTPKSRAKHPASIPKTPASTSKATRKSLLVPKTPSHIRNRVKRHITKVLDDSTGSDFSVDDSEFEPSDTESSSGKEDSSATDDVPKTPSKNKKAFPVMIPVLPKTPSALRSRSALAKVKTPDYIPESDEYFQKYSSSKIHTSDHTLDRLKNPRLSTDRLFSLLSDMKLSAEHEQSINDMIAEYKTYFTKWFYLLHEGFNLLVYGLGSKRQLLLSFHREILAEQPVVVINGFFPSLTLKDILDSIANNILDLGISPTNPRETVDMIEEEFALIPETHLYLIIHNLDGPMLRNNRSQAILSRLAKVPNIHLLASIDHINTPLLWDNTKLSNFNFTWWDCTTMLPYKDETAYENSMLVQCTGELALSSLRSVFLSLTANSKSVYMIIVKHQLKNKATTNYQGMPFKDLYWSCRESFLVSSDLVLRAQLTEFLDHKLVKSKRSVDGTEQLIIPIDSSLLQQFLDEQEKP
uniref:Origin recognition complex subunit 2 n=1 Tax=Glossina pallidipes TaxID=7398 RepID=A0A1A9ZVC8_GLOPL